MNDNGRYRFQRIGAHLSRSTRLGCLRCHERRIRLDGAIHRRSPCTAQDSRKRGGPGATETPISKRGPRANATQEEAAKLSDFFSSTVPLGRWGKREDLAKTVLFLASAIRRISMRSS
jgi:hypothetical protein